MEMPILVSVRLELGEKDRWEAVSKNQSECGPRAPGCV